ncbi:uncharacterized protein M6B38_414390 [Iris pallida]|uniref:Uncharacterized protein n=1 Tax=Iris pallida TaxID=29817 RepID=A0AAX6FJG3_IRIPA|nr:uncharacterized protein M6B38_414390 [Iris pallida]
MVLAHYQAVVLMGGLVMKISMILITHKCHLEFIGVHSVDRPWVLSSFEEGEISPAIAFQDVVGYHVMFTGNPATSSVSNRCPYSTYMPSRQPSSSSNPPVSAESCNDGLAVHHPRSRTSRQTCVQSPHVLPAVDYHYRNWEHHSPPHSQPSSHSSGSSQDTNTSARVQAVRLDLDGLPSAGFPVHHFVLGHGSSSRSTGTFMPTVAPPYFNSQPHPPVRDNPPNMHNPLSVHRTTFSGPQRSGVRGLPATSHLSPLDPTNYYLFPSTASSSRSSQESESRRSDHLARDRFAPLPLLPVDRDTTWWMPLPQSAGLPDSRSMWGFRHRNGSERPSSRGMREGSSYRPSPVSRMRPYN